MARAERQGGITVRRPVGDQRGEGDRLERAFRVSAHALEGIEEILARNFLASLDLEGVPATGD
eukprot:6721244-Pyramimonas_sp.AAC.1